MKRVLVSAWFAGTMLCGLFGAEAGTITVNSGGDAGGPCPGVACTLRQAILDATPGDTIDFAPGLTTIDLTSAELFINKKLTISGPGADLLAVQRSTAGGTPDFRIFNIAGGNVTIFGLTIFNGVAPDTTGGGGIFNSNGATVNVVNSTLDDNSARGALETSGGGGGILNSGGGTVTITNSTLSRNSGAGGAHFSGGGGAIRNNGGTVTITNSTISFNHGGSSGGGGGILNANGGIVNITNSTVAANNGTGWTIAAAGPGGISNGGTVNAKNTIIATNTSRGQPNDFGGTLTSEGYNLIGNTSDTIITGITTGNQLNVDPLLGPLQDNGGATFTQALLSGSTAIDGGQSSGATTDQRGFTRPIDDPAIQNAEGGDGSDIGAYEEQTLTPIPTPTPTPTPPPPPPPTPTPTLTPTPSPTPTAQALNLSTRMFVQTGDNVGIGGFIIQGSVPKRVMLRGVGPSTVPGALADPVLELHGPPGFATVINDNCDPGFIPSPFCMPGSLDAAIEANLDPGAYTAIVRGKDNTTGIALVEVYDLNQSVDSKLANISTRAFVSTGDNIVIAGFILGGNSGNATVVARGIGPSLTALGVANALANPTLELRDSNAALLALNNDWRDDISQAQQLTAKGLAPTNDLESGLIVTLPPGLYTALLAGVNNGTGIGLVEVYDSGPPVPTPTLPPPPTTTPPPPITPTPTPSPGITPTPTPSATPTPTFPPPNPPCAQNFDGVIAPALPPGWSGSWVTSTIDPDSPPNAAFVPNAAVTSDESLFSLPININSASAQIIFRNNFNTEHNPPPTEVFYDGYVLEVSTDGGTSYNDIIDVGGVFVSGPYTGEISGLGNNPLAGRMAWSGNSGGYIDTVINLPTSFNGQTIKLKFRMGTDMVIGAPGVRIDNFSVTGSVCP